MWTQAKSNASSEGFSINDGDTLSISNDEGSGECTVTSGISFQFKIRDEDLD